MKPPDWLTKHRLVAINLMIWFLVEVIKLSVGNSSTWVVEGGLYQRKSVGGGGIVGDVSADCSYAFICFCGRLVKADRVKHQCVTQGGGRGVENSPTLVVQGGLYQLKSGGSLG
jgi:hypothetical protein